MNGGKKVKSWKFFTEKDLPFIWEDLFGAFCSAARVNQGKPAHHRFPVYDPTLWEIFFNSSPF
jgi:hypothetical protein